MRQELLDSINNTNQYDIIIVGGGIHGATLANLAAMNNQKVLLLEKWDYACATSGRSSKMAHGGLRYLEMLDLQQVFEGIKAREKLIVDFPYMVRPYQFAVPVHKRDWWFRLKLGIGLYLYDLMLKDKSQKHSWMPASKLKETGFSESNLELDGCYIYKDGIFNDSRLVLEQILRAQTSGATCLNYAKVNYIDNKDCGVEIEFEDILSKKNHSVKSRWLVNCAGPWAPLLNDHKLGLENYPVRYSRGIHLLFNKKFNGPALFLPMEGKARYYFVWPHFSGTMVGTTERETDIIENDPFPRVDEVQEVIDRIQRDLPDSGLSLKNLHYAFAGVRTLPLRSGKKGVFTLSRKHIWDVSKRCLTLYGGKYTTSEWTVCEALNIIAKTEGRKFKLPIFKKVDLVIENQILDWKKQAKVHGINKEHINRLLISYGVRVLNMYKSNEDYNCIYPNVTKAEIDQALNKEQAETLEDLMCRRLNLEYLPGAGLDSLKAITSYCKEKISSNNFSEEVKDYENKIARFTKLKKSISDNA